MNPIPSHARSSDAPARQTVLIVDDTPQNLTILGELLQPYYRVRAANSGERALRAAGLEPPPDLILLDVMMPGMDGYAVLEHLRAEPRTAHVPVIFVTAMNGVENEERGLELGAVDYITKPINPAVVLARVRTHLELKHARDRLALENEWLEREVARRMSENLLIQELSVRALACLSEARDNETGLHIVRTQTYVELLAQHLQGNEAFRPALDNGRLQMVVKAAPLHDIGKVGVPDRILLKPGELTPAEFEIMKRHTTLGRDAISKAETLFGVSSSFLRFAKEIAYSHQEKWDGSGYPQGLAGERIPLAARLMAVADSYDGLISQRVYKKAHSHAEAVAILAAHRGTHFDPDIIDAFLEVQSDFQGIARRFADAPIDEAAEAERVRLILG